MKKYRRILSVLLCVLMLTAMTAPALSASAATVCTCENTPVVYIKGRTNIYKTPDDTSDGNLAETNFSGGTESIIEASSNIIPAFAAALITDEWDDYCDILFEEIRPIYDQYKLNNDGEVDNASGVAPYWTLENMLARVVAAGKNGHKRYADNITATQFQYDMRIDPCKNAEYLNTYIEKIKEVSGHSKVCIVSRCEGTVIANAYFNMYGYDSVEKNIVFNSIASGAEIADDIYSNKVILDADAMNRFVNTFIDTSPVLDFVKATVNLATFNGLLDDGLGFVNDIYGKISANLMPRLIREIFGCCPGWWGMISLDAYEDCKNFVLDGNKDGTYDKLVEKIENYNVYKANALGILEEMQQNGVEVYVIAKYGSQMYPCIENYDILGDGVVSVYRQTFCGAETAEITGTLSEDYVAERTEAGFGKYISADRKIDASTAPFKDHTWYIKELEHHMYPAVTDQFMLRIIRYDGYATVDTFEDVPQYTLYKSTLDENDKDIGELIPLTEENKDVTEDTTDTSSVLAVLIKFLTSLLNFITHLFKK